MSCVINKGDRKSGMDFLKRFVRQNSPKVITIIDPYFSDKDVELVKQLSDWAHGAHINVLTSCDQKNDFSKSNFLKSWESISVESAPTMHMVKVCDANFSKSPFHDRYMIVDDATAGLKVGTSFNSIGVNKISAISYMESSELELVTATIINPLLHQKLRSYIDFTNLKYEQFDL